jgi:hypothetical protein
MRSSLMGTALFKFLCSSQKAGLCLLLMRVDIFQIPKTRKHRTVLVTE